MFLTRCKEEEKDKLMPKVNKSGSEKPENNGPKPVEMKKTGEQSSPATSASTEANKSRQSGKSHKSTIGGTAIPGARSTQPREVKAVTPQEQQAESYSRQMRRRMQHLGMGPYGENPATTVGEQRRKRLEKRKKRQEEVKQVVSRGPKPNLSLGRRNTYFLIAVVALIVLIIVLALIINHPFH